LIAFYLDLHLDVHIFLHLFTYFYIFFTSFWHLFYILLTSFLHLVYIFFTSFYYLTNHCSLSIFRPICRVNEPKEPKDSSEPTLREAWICGEIGEPGFIVPNSIQIGRNSTNFYPILPTFWR
jgi:predicted membrane protein